MSQKKQAHQKHIPQRVCVGCRETLAKRTLVRLVRGSDGVKVDPTGKVSGRGAYLHTRRACWEQALRGPLEQALKTRLSDADREALTARAAEMTADDNDEPAQSAPGGGSA
jgi:predicted RNA-binding protein YlxR (DUF448 family)